MPCPCQGALSVVSCDRAPTRVAVCAQMKVFSTAIFAVLVLSRVFSLRKWRALFTLTLGQQAAPARNGNVPPICSYLHLLSASLISLSYLSRVLLLADSGVVGGEDAWCSSCGQL